MFFLLSSSQDLSWKKKKLKTESSGNWSVIYDLNVLFVLFFSGEAGFRAIAEYFGYAKNPMIKRIDKVDNNIPIWFIYGSRSWIDSAAGFNAMFIRQGSILTSVKVIYLLRLYVLKRSSK